MTCLHLFIDSIDRTVDPSIFDGLTDAEIVANYTKPTCIFCAAKKDDPEKKEQCLHRYRERPDLIDGWQCEKCKAFVPGMAQLMYQMRRACGVKI